MSCSNVFVLFYWPPFQTKRSMFKRVSSASLGGTKSRRARHLVVYAKLAAMVSSKARPIRIALLYALRVSTRAVRQGRAVRCSQLRDIISRICPLAYKAHALQANSRTCSISRNVGAARRVTIQVTTHQRTAGPASPESF